MSKLIMFVLSTSLIFGAIEIENLNPNEAEAGSNLSVELTANNVNFYDGYTSVENINFNPTGINVDSFSVSSSNTIILNLDIDKISGTWFDVELVGEFYDQYDQYAISASKDDAFYVSSNNPLLVIDAPQNFGEVNVGGYYQIDAIVYNPSTIDLEIYGISMSNSDFTVSQYPGLSAGETDSWPITFTPSTPGEQNNIMTIYSNDEFDPVQVFQMSGVGIGLLGDLNYDGDLNILDIVTLIDYVFNDNENPVADLNGDGSVNIVDVVMLINLVLNYGL